MSQNLLLVFVGFSVLQYLVERFLGAQNRRFYLNKINQERAKTALNISSEDMEKSVSYAEDKYIVGSLERWLVTFATLLFLALGGLGMVEEYAQNFASTLFSSEIVAGLTFFALLGLLSWLVNIPFNYYRVFIIEEKHGFNRQTKRSFWLDQVKGIAVGIALGGPILSLILWIMAVSGDFWWLYAWLAISFFSVLTAWIYPTLLAPLFNKFSPLPDGELKEKINQLAQAINFKTDSLFVMDASTRSSHGNAYFTGLFRKKRIVLFDTLLESLSPPQIVSVLAHELGHFKLHHVRWMMLRSILTTGLFLYLMSLCISMSEFYTAFHLSGISSYGALFIFSAWFGLIGFWLSPIQNSWSRSNEFAADRFALLHTQDRTLLANALLKLREKSQGLPIAHPLYSLFYYSHPPLIERLAAMKE